MHYLIIFIITIVLSLLLTLAVKKIANYFKIQDKPDDLRKKHKKSVPLLGGVAPFLTFFIVIGALFYFNILPTILFSKFIWLFIASIIIMIGGFLDDKYLFIPRYQIVFPVLAIIIALWGGIKMEFITNPLGGMIYLGGAMSVILSFFWLMTVTYTTKILDGLDGLVSGVVALGAVTIFLFTTFTDFREIGLSYTALILAGAFIGFLFFNFYPAKIFLGEGGSLWAGFILGSIAILTGAKLAVTLMVLALPLIDMGVVVIKRVFIHKKSFLKGDRTHLHFILVDKGWRVRSVVFIFWMLAALMGITSVFLPSIIKLATLGAILFIYFWTEIFFFTKK